MFVLLKFTYFSNNTFACWFKFQISKGTKRYTVKGLPPIPVPPVTEFHSL